MILDRLLNSPLFLQARRSARQPLIYNAGFILAVNLIPALTGLAFWGIASRLYPASEVGIASVVISSVALVAGIGGVGSSFGVIRFLPESSNPCRLLNSIYTANFILSLLAGLVYIIGLEIWSPSLLAYRSDLWNVLGYLVFVASITLGAVVRDTFVARLRAVYAFFYTLISNGLRLALIFVGTHWGAQGLVGSAIFAYIAALLVSWFGFLPAVEKGYRVGIALDRSILKVILPYSSGNYIANLLVQLPQTVLPMLILERLGAAASGYAYIALMLGIMLPGPGLALASSAFAEGSNDPSGAMRILFKAFWAAGLVTLALAGAFFFGARWALLAFGPDYAVESAALLRWMALASPLIVLNQLYFTHLRLQKRTARLFALSGVIAALTLLAAWQLMPRLGICANGMGILLANALVALPLLAGLARKNLAALQPTP